MARINKRPDNIAKNKIKSRPNDRGNFGDTKNIGDDLYELRLFFGSGYRIYYTIENDILVILFSGGDKSSQNEDIKKAKLYLKDYKGGKNDK